MEEIITDYKDFDEKGGYFYSGDKVLHFESVDDLFQILHTEYNSGNSPFVFRGLKEAKYRLFSTGQRDYVNRKFIKMEENEYLKHYENYIIESVNKVKMWNNGVVRKLFIRSGIDENNTLSWLSFMQHHGIPTPLMDFTSNPFIALYFAIGNHDGKVKIDRSNLLDGFISIYRIYKPTIMHEMFHSFFEFQGKDLNKITYPELSSEGMGLYLLSNEDDTIKVYNNARIINQEGLFYYNNHPFCPLEVKYYLKAQELTQDRKLDSNLKKRITNRIGFCMNIYKGLIPEIRARLDKMGINKKFLFPDYTNINTDID